MLLMVSCDRSRDSLEHLTHNSCERLQLCLGLVTVSHLLRNDFYIVHCLTLLPSWYAGNNEKVLTVINAGDSHLIARASHCDRNGSFFSLVPTHLAGAGHHLHLRPVWLRSLAVVTTHNFPGKDVLNTAVLDDLIPNLNIWLSMQTQSESKCLIFFGQTWPPFFR